MDVLQAVKSRRSIRKFLRRDVSEEMINTLSEALIWAPSAGNLQSRKFFFVREQTLKKQLADAALSQYFISEAPVCIVCCADTRIGLHYGQRGIDLYCLQDVSASIMAMMLVAYENGLGTCWVGAFHEEKVSELMHLPDHLRPVAIVPVGYPEKTPRPTSRVSPSEAVELL